MREIGGALTPKWVQTKPAPSTSSSCEHPTDHHQGTTASVGQSRCSNSTAGRPDTQTPGRPVGPDARRFCYRGVLQLWSCDLWPSCSPFIVYAAMGTFQHALPLSSLLLCQPCPEHAVNISHRTLPAFKLPRSTCKSGFRCCHKCALWLMSSTLGVLPSSTAVVGSKSSVQAVGVSVDVHCLGSSH